MLNLHELESRWRRYKLKSLIPLFVIFFIFLIILYIVFNNILINNISSEKKFSVEVETNIPKKIEKIILKQEKENIPIDISSKLISTSHITAKQKIILKPSLDFIKNIQISSPQYYNEKQFQDEKKKKKTIVKKKPKKIPLAEPIKVEVVKNSLINIKRQNTKNDIQHVIKRFKKSNNPALSLFIAKKYYDLQNYKEAYNYALITNDINNEIEESWIIFAKSLVKLAKKDKAIKMLQKYINNTDSQAAKLLLNKIKSGKLK